jgi:F0F1-type ATP synthase assembly protein I
VGTQDGDGKPSLGDSLKSLQSAATKAGPAAAASYTLVGAIIVLGAAGYGIDAWLGTNPWGVMIGLGLGIVVGFYELIKSTSQKP